jgi:hypothetical protein
MRGVIGLNRDGGISSRTWKGLALSADATLSLTSGAVEARAAGLDDALDAAGRRELAVAARAALALMLVDPPAVVEIAEFAIGLT